MKRSAAIITATFAVLAMSSCSAVRQLDRIDNGGGTPTPTTVYVVDIGTPAFPVIPAATVADPCTAGTGPCAPTTTTVAAPLNDPPCDTAGLPNPCQTPPTTLPVPATGVCNDGFDHSTEGACP